MRVPMPPLAPQPLLLALILPLVLAVVANVSCRPVSHRGRLNRPNELAGIGAIPESDVSDFVAGEDLRRKSGEQSVAKSEEADFEWTHEVALRVGVDHH